MLADLNPFELLSALTHPDQRQVTHLLIQLLDLLEAVLQSVALTQAMLNMLKVALA